MDAENIVIEEELSQQSDNKQPSETFGIQKLQQQKIIRYKMISCKNQNAIQFKLFFQLKDLFVSNFPKMDSLDIINMINEQENKKLIMLMNDQVLGGLCFRIYKQQKMAIISLLAVDQDKKNKGIGSRLLDVLKNYLQSQKINLILTYADYLAIRFFKKKGFSTEITVEKKLSRNLITKNLGAVLMQCEVSQKINYLQKKMLIKAYGEFIQSRVKKICIQKVILKTNLQAQIKIKTIFDSRNPHLVAQTVAKLPGFQEFQQMMAESELQLAESKIQIRKQCQGLMLQLRSHPKTSIFKRKKQFYNGIDNTSKIFQINQKLNNDCYENFQEFAKDITSFILSLQHVSKNSSQLKNAQFLKQYFQEKIQNLRHLDKILSQKGFQFKQPLNKKSDQHAE